MRNILKQPNGYTIEQERDGSFSVYCLARGYMVNRKTIQECKAYIAAL